MKLSYTEQSVYSRSILGTCTEFLLAVSISGVNFENRSYIIWTCSFPFLALGTGPKLSMAPISMHPPAEKSSSIPHVLRVRFIVGAWATFVNKYVQITSHPQPIKMFRILSYILPFRCVLLLYGIETSIRYRPMEWRKLPFEGRNQSVLSLQIDFQSPKSTMMQDICLAARRLDSCRLQFVLEGIPSKSELLLLLHDQYLLARLPLLLSNHSAILQFTYSDLSAIKYTIFVGGAAVLLIAVGVRVLD